MIGWIIGGIIIGLIVLITIIKMVTRNRNSESDEEGDIWSQVRRIKRGACKKFKDMFGEKESGC